jgi:bZIP transcription factor
MTARASAMTLTDIVMNMELTSHDDDLLSYFLSSDVAAEEQLAQAKAEPIEYGGGMATTFAVGVDNTDTPRNSTVQSPTAVLSQLNNVTMQASNAFYVSTVRPSQDEDAASSNGNGQDTDEKRQRRLARNRESARQSRRRKKQYLELLEEKVDAISRVSIIHDG